MVDRLHRLLRIPSISGSAEEITAQRFFVEEMRSAGLETDLWEIPLAETIAHPDFPGSEVERASALGLVGSTPDRGDGPTDTSTSSRRTRALVLSIVRFCGVR